MKISINSLEALERLIGGDNELEIEIRNSVVQNFSNKYLKGIANTFVEKGIKDTIRHIISKKGVTEKVKSGWGTSEVLTGTAKELINKSIDSKIKNEIGLKVYEAFENNATMKDLNKRIENAAERIERELTDPMIERRIEELVNIRMKEKLGIK